VRGSHATRDRGLANRAAARLAAGLLAALTFAACGGGGGGGTTPPTNNPVPSITALSPSSVTARTAPVTLTVTGSNFISSSQVSMNGLILATTFTSSTEVRAGITATNIPDGGTVPVTVFNPAPGGGTSNSLPFTINNPVPAITSLSPSSALAGGPTYTLTVNGSGFVPSSVAQWNGADLTTTFVSEGQLTASVPASNIAAVGTAQVTVVNPAPGGGTSNPSISLAITAPQPISFLTTSLPGTSVGKSYYFVMSATGGVPPLNWSVGAGNLPSGLVLDATTDTFGNPPSSIAGRIHGDITGSTATFTVQVTDSAVPTPHTGTQQFTIPVASGALPSNNLVCSPSNVSDVATAISNGTIRASISPYGDIDVYSFHGTAGQQVNMEIFAQRLNLYGGSFPQDSYLDSMMELLDKNCQTLAFDDDISSGVVTDSKISVSATPFPPACPAPSPTSPPCADIPPATNSLPYTGTYYIRIRDFRSDGRPDFIYELTLSGAD